ncbi:MAG: hypothetical protein Q9160_004768 [Pyrenula sp. 1 TL-2023]
MSTFESSQKPFTVAIIGAGPAGLTLARLLDLHASSNLTYTIFELDASPTSRYNQGGSLDLHTTTGLAALKKADLWPQFLKHARYDGEALTVANKHAKAVFRKEGGKEGDLAERPEIDRERLKEILLASVPAENIKWGRKLREVSPDGKLHFENSSQDEGPFDLIVGADGAWSKVRPLLSSNPHPHYSGISGIELTISRPHETCPAVDTMIGPGSYFCYAESKSIQAQRQGNKSIKIICFGRGDDGWAKVLIQKCDGDPAVMKKTLLQERYADWAPMVKAWVEAADDDASKTRPWSLHELPVDHRWEHRRGFTLIGDAAHLATPFAGEGVNAAMTDAMDLADAITSSLSTHTNTNITETVDAAISHFETTSLFPRGSDVAKRTIANKDGMFADDAPKGWWEKMKRRVLSEIERMEDPQQREVMREKIRAMERMAEEEGVIEATM